MNTRSIFRPLSTSTLACLLAASLGGCIIPGNVGEDPESASGNLMGDTEGASSTSGAPTGSASHTSADPSASGGAVSITETVTGAGTATVGPLDEDAALDFCEVPVVEPPPEGPAYLEFIECAGGCILEVELAELIGLFEYGDCLCAAMDCGPLVGGGGGGPAPDGPTGGSTGDSGDTEEPPDGCGPFPPGGSEFTCNCEMCSIDVSDVDVDWLDNEADLESICDCMCGNTGCGMPV